MPRAKKEYYPRNEGEGECNDVQGLEGDVGVKERKEDDPPTRATLLDIKKKSEEVD